ncbi:cytochrome-c peroxidase [Chitinophagaceae bacterium IBVUCB1]|nr:cytochrome-c peroxidase [Chitinophagaceae bacterium IBVUCB1]
MHTPKYLIAFLLVLIHISSCKKTKTTPNNTTGTTTSKTDNEIIAAMLNLPETPYNYSVLSLPGYFGAPPIASTDNTPVNTNPITNDGATLGRVLFYDKSLSLNNTIACASCHKQENSFSDPLQFSKGFLNGNTDRNSMSLANARYYTNGRFFWDERAITLEDQTLMPIQHPVEMGMTLDSLEAKLNTKDYYKVLFRKAFGEEKVTRDRISKALAQFIRSMVSYQSKYDDGLVSLGHPPAPNEDLPGFSQLENQGLRAFNANCAGPCHNTELQTMPVARNNGLDLVYTDNGVGKITGRPTDNGKFKSPSLRNVMLTAPYMHDGRFLTIEQVIEHYSSGIKNHPNLDNRLKDPVTGQARPLNLTQQQKNAIVAFLNTLTDNKFISDMKYSNPFK